MFAAAQGRVDGDQGAARAQGRSQRRHQGEPRSSTMGERYKKRRPAAKARAGSRREGGRSDVTAMGGMTALHVRRARRAPRRVRALVDGGADVNKVNGADEHERRSRWRSSTATSTSPSLPARHAAPTRSCSPRAASARCLPPSTRSWPERTWYPPATQRGEDHAPGAAAALLDQGRRSERAHRTQAVVSARSTATGPIRSAPRRSGWPPRPTTSRRCGSSSPAAPTRSIPSTRGVTPLLVAAGYGLEPQVTNFAPDARLAAVRYLVEELQRRRQRPRQPGLHAAPRRGADGRSRRDPVSGRHGRRRRRRAPRTSSAARARPTRTPTATAGRHGRRHGQRPARAQHAVPRNRALPRALGSANSNNCRYATCVVQTLPAAKK